MRRYKRVMTGYKKEHLQPDTTWFSDSSIGATCARCVHLFERCSLAEQGQQRKIQGARCHDLGRWKNSFFSTKNKFFFRVYAKLKNVEVNLVQLLSHGLFDVSFCTQSVIVYSLPWKWWPCKQEPNHVLWLVILHGIFFYPLVIYDSYWR